MLTIQESTTCLSCDQGLFSMIPSFKHFITMLHDCHVTPSPSFLIPPCLVALLQYTERHLYNVKVVHTCTCERPGPEFPIKTFSWFSERSCTNDSLAWPSQVVWVDAFQPSTWVPWENIACMDFSRTVVSFWSWLYTTVLSLLCFLKNCTVRKWTFAAMNYAVCKKKNKLLYWPPENYAGRLPNSLFLWWRMYAWIRVFYVKTAELFS